MIYVTRLILALLTALLIVGCQREGSGAEESQGTLILSIISSSPPPRADSDLVQSFFSTLKGPPIADGSLLRFYDSGVSVTVQDNRIVGIDLWNADNDCPRDEEHETYSGEIPLDLDMTTFDEFKGRLGAPSWSRAVEVIGLTMVSWERPEFKIDASYRHALSPRKICSIGFESLYKE